VKQPKLDLTKEYKTYYTAAKTMPEIVEVEEGKFLTIEEGGVPGVMNFKLKLELVNEVKFEKMKEGKCVQILHIGPYSTEPESLEKMYNLMKGKKLVYNGFHHEIYISDPRKIAPEKMKTILRQPVRHKNE